MTQSDSNRMSATALLQDAEYDLLVVGGGIVGAGVARDAALRGLRVLLVEQNDFASGTSGRSTRLLHGGIRYLAQGRVGLVREASVEKTIVHRIAPQLSEPLAFIFPTRKNSEWSRWKLAIGVKIYDWLCGLGSNGSGNLGKSSVLSRGTTLQTLPQLNPERLTGAVRYYDGLTNDARLVLDTLRSAAHAGAQVMNYTSFVDAKHDDGVWRCELQLPETGEKTEIRAKCVVNAAGPWSHKLPHSRTALRLTKGVHLVIDRGRLSVPDAVVVTEGTRILFVIPWGDRLILGTTDTDYHGRIDSPECDAEDTQYVLDAANESFPTAKLTPEDVISTWAGLRPLVADKKGNPSDISRRHEVKMSNPGWWDVTGGKLTTYRLMAEETIDSIVQFIGGSFATCQTATTPLLQAAQSDEVSSILPPTVSRKVVEQCCREEWAVHLDDLMIRRTSWRYYNPNHREIAQQVSVWMAELLDWTDADRLAELDRYTLLTGGTTNGSANPCGTAPKPHMVAKLSDGLANGNPVSGNGVAASQPKA